MGDLVGKLQLMEKGRPPAAPENIRVLAVEINFEEPRKVTSVVATCTNEIENSASDEGTPATVQVTRVLTTEQTEDVATVESTWDEVEEPSSVIPEEEANAEQETAGTDPPPPP